jgi:hypothetical protein
LMPLFLANSIKLGNNYDSSDYCIDSKMAIMIMRFKSTSPYIM